MTDQEIIRALRCSSSAAAECMEDACPFYRKDELPDEYKDKYPADFFYGCDVDEIVIVAADRLEELTGGCNK